MITLIEDTRNQIGKHTKKNIYFQSIGVNVVRSKLPAGDYALLTDMSRVIDTKFGISEICSNLTQDHERIRREADFCKDNGIEFIILIEEPNMKSLEDVKHWDNPRLHRWNKIRYMHEQGKWLSIPLPKQHPTTNITLYKIMYSFGKNHNVRWEFCSPKDAGKRILELLTEGKDIEQT